MRALAQAGKIVAVTGLKEAEMVDIRVVSDRFSVAPQIALEDLPQLASVGYRHIINNRPDNEDDGQPDSAEFEVAAKQAGLTYVYAPFVGQPTAEAVKAAMMARVKTLAFCRSGTRSVNAWAMAQASEGEDALAIVAAASGAGYNLAGMTGLLRQLGAR